MPQTCTCNISTKSCKCNNCYGCLSTDQIRHQVLIRNKIPRYSKLIYCNCFQCNDRWFSMSCIENNYFSTYNTHMVYNDRMNESRSAIREEKQKAKRKLFWNYIRTLSLFDTLFLNILEKRYAPDGKGYVEAKNEFLQLNL